MVLPALAVAAPAKPGHPVREDPRVIRRDRGLVARWNCEAPDDTLVKNCAGDTLQGTNHGAQWSAGSFEFDGVDDYVSIASPLDTLAGLSTGTISVWFKADVEKFGTCVQPILYFGDADGGYDNTSLIIELGHFWPDQKKTALFFTLLTEPGLMPTFCFDTLFDLQLDTWYHFVVIVGEDFNTAYLNGMELTARNYNYGGPGDSAFFDHIPTPDSCLLGKGWFWLFLDPCYFDGRIGEIRIYNRPLATSEVRDLYQEGSQTYANRNRLRQWQRDSGGPRGGVTSSLGGAGLSSAPPTSQPNPFASRTTISFTLPADSRVRLEILDLRGRLVRTLADEDLAAGEHRREWDGRGMDGDAAPNGIYFYRLLTGGRVQTVGKVLLLR